MQHPQVASILAWMWGLVQCCLLGIETDGCCARRKALAGLRFELDGKDLTGADARLTQAAIERELSVGLLSRAAFHGQADITSLLEARLLLSWAPHAVTCRLFLALPLLTARTHAIF